MRLPLSKIYRAFPELDRFSDAECASYVRHVSHRMGVRIVLTAWATALLSMFGLPLLLCLGAPLVGGAGSGPATVIGIAALLGLFTGPLWGFMCRDVLLRRAIRERIKHATCPTCFYSLIGLRVSGGSVRCPECGGSVELDRHDLTPGDLVAERS